MVGHKTDVEEKRDNPRSFGVHTTISQVQQHQQ